MSGRQPEEPVRLPVNRQTWQHLTFLHYRYPVAQVQRLVPDGLSVQEWGGTAWVGITPFLMRDVSVPSLPPPPGWGAFAELNVRTYVQGPEGRDGLWFLGMVVPRLTFVVALRSLGLPYARAAGQVDVHGARWGYWFHTPQDRLPSGDDAGRPDPARHTSPWFEARVDVRTPVATAERTLELDSITGRWAAYHQRAGILWRTPVRHEVWPLHHAEATGKLTAPLRWVGLPPPTEPPMVHSSPGVATRLGMPRPATARRV
ncbi:YqjF family protein [Ornithinimicrobium pratense]|uniref:YqjF family protein n=1 Tax=Ornithinimicrobium pratense TaxID=2593973 RepID=UPI0017885E54|nr:DUF2071 domain-containing protein [Ornithinimicrobium pratense]